MHIRRQTWRQSVHFQELILEFGLCYCWNFGLAGANLHDWTGFRSISYWNAYVAVTQMHGSGTFFDARLSDPTPYPVAAKSGSSNVRGTPDLVTGELPALHFYQLAIPAPRLPAGSFDADAAARGQILFDGKAKCATCHVPPLYTEPGSNLHASVEVCVDSFQADRSPTHMYRTSPLAGVWVTRREASITTGALRHSATSWTITIAAPPWGSLPRKRRSWWNF